MCLLQPSLATASPCNPNTHRASPVIPAKHKHLHTPTPVMAQVLGLLLWQQCLCMGMFECLKSSGSRHVLRLSVEATPWFLHAYSKSTPHKPTFSHHPGERPAGCVTESQGSFSRKGLPLHLGTPSGLRPCPPSLARAGPSLHAAAGWDLASVTEPGHLWPGKAGNARCSDDSGFSVGHTLVLLAFLKAPHVCREGRCRGQKVNPVSGTGRQRKTVV